MDLTGVLFGNLGDDADGADSVLDPEARAKLPGLAALLAMGEGSKSDDDEGDGAEEGEEAGEGEGLQDILKEGTRGLKKGGDGDDGGEAGQEVRHVQEMV